jgi:hypothetical protein
VRRDASQSQIASKVPTGPSAPGLALSQLRSPIERTQLLADTCRIGSSSCL